MNVREWALPVYTILIQIATGILLMVWIFRSLNSSKLKREEMDQMIDNPITIIFLTVITAIIGSHFHLSRPLLSFLAVRNFKSSWLSREIVFTIIFFLAVGSLWLLRRRKSYHRTLEIFLGWFAVIIGFVSIYCMARIYLLPTQVTWNSPITITYYLITTLLLGSMATAVLFVMDLKFAEVRELDIPKTRIAIIEKSLIWLAVIASIMAIMVFVLNFYQISYLQNAGETAKTSLNLLLGLYQPLFRLRLGLMPTGVGLLVISVILMTRKKKNVLELVTFIYITCLLVMIAEILGRFIFYATHVSLGI